MNSSSPAMRTHRQSISERAASSCKEVEYEDDQSENQQEVNQTTPDMQAETEKPENQNDDKDCPKHN
jgi:Sec-independent protein translocase protein TatA